MSGADAAALVLRLVVGGIFVAQGWRKVVAPAGAKHGRGDLAAMIAAGGFPAPARLAWLVGATELACGALLLAGLVTRAATLPPMGILVVAIARYKWRAGFFGGWDWPLAVLGAALALFFVGPGPLSLDAVLTR